MGIRWNLWFEWGRKSERNRECKIVWAFGRIKLVSAYIYCSHSRRICLCRPCVCVRYIERAGEKKMEWDIYGLNMKEKICVSRGRLVYYIYLQCEWKMAVVFGSLWNIHKMVNVWCWALFFCFHSVTIYANNTPLVLKNLILAG